VRSAATRTAGFSGVAAEQFPSPSKDLHVYAQLSSLVGDVRVRLTCLQVGAADAEEVYSTEHVIRFHGKLTVEQVHFVWHQFQFPIPGEYLFQLWTQGECIAERRLIVRPKGGS